MHRLGRWDLYSLCMSAFALYSCIALASWDSDRENGRNRDACVVSTYTNEAINKVFAWLCCLRQYLKLMVVHIFSPTVPVCHKSNAWCLSSGNLHMLSLWLLSIPARLVGGQDCLWWGPGCRRNSGFRGLPKTFQQAGGIPESVAMELQLPALWFQKLPPRWTSSNELKRYFCSECFWPENFYIYSAFLAFKAVVNIHVCLNVKFFRP